MSDSNSDLSKISDSEDNVNEFWMSTMAKKRAKIILEKSILLLSLDI